MPNTYTVKQVADILGYSTNSIYTFLKEKRIKGVRVGKGRFRIPQAELDRLLAVSPSKNQQAQIVGMPQSAPEILAPERLTSLTDSHIHVPNFFDWYIGSVALCMSATFMLVSPLIDGMRVAPYLVFQPLLQVLLAVGAVGLLYTDIMDHKTNRWRGVFYGLLLLGITAAGVLFFRNGDYPFTFLVAALIVAALMRLFAQVDGVRVYGWYMGLTWVVLIGSCVMFPQDERIHALMNLNISPTVLWSIGVGAAVTVLILSRFVRDIRALLSGLRVGSGVMFIAIALWLGVHAYWIRSFIFLTTGFYAFFVSVWLSLILTRRDHQRMIFQLVGCMLSLSLLAIVFVRLFQQNVLSYAQVDLKQKTQLATLTIASSVEKAQRVLVTFTQNPLVTAAVKAEKVTDLEGLSRSVFESNAPFRRVVITRADGQILSYYPLRGAVPTTASLGNRDYFLQAVVSKKPVISEVVNSMTTPSRPSVAIAVPMVNAAKEVVGMVVGVLELDAINLQVQQLVTSARGEYVVVIDQTKKRLMHPDTAMLGKEVRVDDPVLKALAGESDVSNDYTLDETVAMVAYAPIPDMKWGLAVKVSKRMILENTTVSMVTVLALTSVWMVILAVILMRHGKRPSLLEEPNTS